MARYGLGPFPNPDTVCAYKTDTYLSQSQSLLVAQGFVYDASLFLMDHPVGPLPILRAVNRDNTQDMQMHSAAAQRVWHKLRVGVLKLCPANGFGEFKPPKSETRCVVM